MSNRQIKQLSIEKKNTILILFTSFIGYKYFFFNENVLNFIKDINYLYKNQNFGQTSTITENE